MREEQAKIELEEKWRLEHRNTLDKDRVRLLARGTNHKKEKKEKKKKRKKKTKKAKKRKRGKPGGGGTEEDEGGPVRLSAFVQVRSQPSHSRWRALDVGCTDAADARRGRTPAPTPTHRLRAAEPGERNHRG